MRSFQVLILYEHKHIDFQIRISVPLSSNKLGNIFNCDTNLLMPMSSQLFSNKGVLSCNFLATNNF